MSLRIIPRLDIKGSNLVKGIYLEGLRKLGNPEDFALYYYKYGADELMIQDVVASLYDRNSLDEIIERIAQEVFIPITVGGGIRTNHDIYRVLRSGADKVAINTEAIKNPKFIEGASSNFGSSTIVVSIEAIKQRDGSYFAFTDNGREFTGKDVVGWSKEVEDLGAGEILLTSVDNEGTGKGFPLDLVEKVYNSVTIPVLLHGGISSFNNVYSILSENPHINGLCIASSFHYKALKDGKVSIEGTDIGNSSYFVNDFEKKQLDLFSIGDLKKFITSNNIKCREVYEE